MNLPNVPPNDWEAERSAISLVLASGRIPEPLDNLRPDDFYHPVHEEVWNTMQRLLRGGRPCDATTVHDTLLMENRRAALAAMPDLVTGPWNGTAESLTTILCEQSCRRSAQTAGIRLLQALEQSSDDCEAIVQRTEADLAKSADRSIGGVDSRVKLSAFLGEEIPEPRWVIEGLLARGERAIITGEEGLGKSTLSRQIALCGAAGLEPFTGRRIEPVNVLLIDLENPEAILQRRLHELRRAINSHGAQVMDDLFSLVHRKAGINLADSADRRWLQRQVHLQKPDLFVIGPAYKLHQTTNDDKDEVLARTVTGVLDDIRGDSALVLEHHSGNEQSGMARPIRPFGSSLWRRWPEFGYGIRAAQPPKHMKEAEALQLRLVDLVAWRGARDVRSWPKQMKSGGLGLPWVETAF